MRKLGRKIISAVVTVTMLTGVIVPTAFAETDNNGVISTKKVRMNAVAEDILKIFQKKEEHTRSLEITDISFNINRDFDQNCYVTVKNTGKENQEFFLSSDNPYDDIFLGFVEAGSDTQPTLLTAGESTKVKLTVFAQKASKNTYTIPVKAYTIDGTNNILDDEKEITLNLPEEELKFTCDLTASDEDTLEQSYLIVNNGKPLSSVDIYADDTIADYVTFEPGITETPVKAKENISLKVRPNLNAMKKDNITRAEGNIVISSAGKEQKFALVMDTQGKEIHSITMQQLIDYQRGNKQYYNLEADSTNFSDSIEVTDNTESGGEYSISYEIPFVDKNTDTQVAKEISETKISAYNGNQPSGTVIDYDVHEEDDGLVISTQVVVSTSDILDLAQAIQQQLENTPVDGEASIVAPDETSTKKSSKLPSEAVMKELFSGKEKSFEENLNTAIGYIKDGSMTLVSGGQALIKTSTKIVETGRDGKIKDIAQGIVNSDSGKFIKDFDNKTLGKVYNGASKVNDVWTIGSGAYTLITREHFKNVNKVENSPNVSYVDKEVYKACATSKDIMTGVGMTMAVVSLAGGPVGFFVGLGITLASYAVNKYLDDEMDRIEDEADIDKDDPDGSADTSKNKRNQCTNAQKIAVPWNPPLGGGTYSGGSGTPGGHTPQTPTSPPTEPPTSPTEPPTAPTNPTNPTDPTNPTNPTDPVVKPTWTFYLKTDKDSVPQDEDLTLWMESNVDLSQFVFKYQYMRGIESWVNLTDDYVETKQLTTSFHKTGDYVLRAIVKSKTNPDFWLCVDKKLTVTKAANSKAFDNSQMNVFVSTRLQAGDESSNDMNMSTRYMVNGVFAGQTLNDGHSSLSMVRLDMSNVKLDGINTITANYSTTPTHYRTVSDMEIITYYPFDTEVDYVGSLDDYRDMTLKPDFSVYEENIYVDGDFYVGEETTLHCDVYNRNLAGGWYDIIIKDGNQVLYTAQNERLSSMSAKNIEIAWTPQTLKSKISVQLINKCTVSQEVTDDNNFAERTLVATEYQVPEIGGITATTALENRAFSVYTDISHIKNLTDVKMYIDDTEVTELKSALSGNTKRFWYDCKGITSGKHIAKFVATYEKAGNKFDVTENSLTFEVIPLDKSTTTIAKNTADGIKNVSADVYNRNNYVSSYSCSDDGTIIIPFTEAMYKNTEVYQIVVYTSKGIYVTPLKAGVIKVDNPYIQNTFNVNGNGMHNFRYANLYIRNSKSDYYTNIPYKMLNNNKNGTYVICMDNSNYSKYDKAEDAYMLVVTSGNVVHKLQLIENGKRVSDFSKTINLSNSNVYSPVISAAFLPALPVLSDGNVRNVKSSWNTSYQGKADIVVSAFDSEVVSKSTANGKSVQLAENDYSISYTLKSINYIFNVEKGISVGDTDITNRIENRFEGNISTVASAEEKELINIDVYDMLDKNGNQLRYVTAVNNKPIKITVKFTDTQNPENVYTRTVKTDTWDGSLTAVEAPEKAGEYIVSVSFSLVTETAKYGDLNYDGKINSADVSLMKKFLYTDLKPKDKEFLVADIDKSGVIDKKDLNLLKEMLKSA